MLQWRKLRLWKILNVNCWQNRKKIELNEEFIAMSREGQSLWDVIFPSYRDKNEKDNSLNRMSDNIISADPGDS